MISFLIVVAIVCAGCTGSDQSREPAGSAAESAGQRAATEGDAIEIERVLSGVEPGAALLLRLDDGSSLVGNFVRADRNTITLEPGSTVQAVESRRVVEVAISVEASRGATWERVYPAP